MKHSITAVIAAVTSSAALAQGAKPAPTKPEVAVSKAHRHANLEVFFISGEESYQGPPLLTLEEALTQQKVVLHETGKVHELAIENVSDSPVFIQAGDIVKGGKQDRTLRNDQILPPKSGKVPLASFCVESGRWQKRQGEEVGRFSDSKKVLSSNRLKYVARLEGSQGKVWKEVAKTQEKLAEALKAKTRDKRSATSLQLTLENKALAARAKAYREALAGTAKGQTEAIGFAFAINGRIVSADMYASRALFQKLWPKLLEACITEAIAAGAPEKEAATSPKAVKACLARAAAAPAKKKAGTAEASENKEGYFFVSKTGAKQRKRWLRKSFVAR